MKHRKLRIAWSVAWGVVAVLLCVLWVRSYFTWEEFGAFTLRGGLSIVSKDGSLNLDLYSDWRSSLHYRVVPGDRYKVEWRAVTPRPLLKFTSRPLSIGERVVFPHWLPIITAVITAGMPWILRRGSSAILEVDRAENEESQPNTSFWSGVRRGAKFGALAGITIWTIFGVLDLICLILSPRLRSDAIKDDGGFATVVAVVASGALLAFCGAIPGAIGMGVVGAIRAVKFRFTLRTLLIATTLVAVGLGAGCVDVAGGLRSRLIRPLIAKRAGSVRMMGWRES